MKYFACSDVHSAYTPWIEALSESGFDKTNHDHKIIICGDAFDRMDESQKVYDFIMDMIKKDKLIYVKGNHEDLLMECVERKFPYYNDYHNGTIKTIYELTSDIDDDFKLKCSKVQEKMEPLLNAMVDYYETEKYVFVHSCLPVRKNGSFDPNWRKASTERWSESRWGNPFTSARRGILPKNKTLVFGHWHTSYEWAKKEGLPETGEEAKYDTYFGEGYIGLDACTVLSHKVNIVVLEDNPL